MNSLILVKINKTNYEQWKKIFDEDADIQAKMMKNTIVGKVDDDTAMICTEIIDQKMINEFMTSKEFKKMEEELGLVHQVYKVEKIIN